MKFLKSKLFFIIFSSVILLAGVLCVLCISPNIIVTTSSLVTKEVYTLSVGPFVSVFGGDTTSASVKFVESLVSGAIKSTVVNPITPSLSLAFDYVTFIGIVLALIGGVLAIILNKKKAFVFTGAGLCIVGGVLCALQGLMFNTLNYDTYVETAQNCGALGSTILGSESSFLAIGGIVACALFVILAIVFIVFALLSKTKEKAAE